MSVQNVGNNSLQWSSMNSWNINNNLVPPLTGGTGPNFLIPAGSTMLTFSDHGSTTVQLVDAGHFLIHNASSGAETGSVWILTAP